MLETSRETNTNKLMPIADRTEVSHLWSKDYVTGISAFITYVEYDIKRLDKEVKFYEYFIDELSLTFLNSLETLAENAELVEHEGLCDLLTNLKSTLSAEELRSSCQKPLQVVLNETTQWRHGLEKHMRSLYSTYSKDHKALSESLNCYNRKASSLPGTRSTEPNNVQFPIDFDRTLRFNNDHELQSFFQKVKESMPRPKKGFMDYFGVEGKESFQGRTMLDAIRKNTDKMDTSLFNLDRLGQKILDMRLIQEINLSVRKHVFDQDAYYCWNQGSNDAVDGNILTGWFRGLSTGDIKDMDLDELKSRYFDRCSKLEYTKFELEKAIYEIYDCYIKVYAPEIDRVLSRNRQIFNERFKENRKHNTPQAYNNPHVLSEVVGYYTRDNCIPIIKWEHSHKSLECRKMMFGIETIDEDVMEAIRLSLKHLREFSDDIYLKKKVLESWKDNRIDNMNRAINLKIDLMNTFRDIEGATNLESVRVLIRSNRHGVISDWVGMIKLWLLELPDSLIPFKCCDHIVKRENAWLDKIPLTNLLVLIEFCEHFRWLDTCEWDNLEIPLHHLFVRKIDCLRNAEEDFKNFEPWIMSLLINDPDILGRLEEVRDEKRNQAIANAQTLTRISSAATATPSIRIEDDSWEFRPEQLDENFVPRPFRTTSAASSAPGSPVPSSANKRRSGLVIESLGSTESSLGSQTSPAT